MLLAIVLSWLSAASSAIPPTGLSPVLPQTAASAQGFAPPGWWVETQARGDLNSDGTADLAFILLAANPDDLTLGEGGNGNIGDSGGPIRMLAVAFGRPGERFELVHQNRGFLPQRRPPNGLSAGWMLFRDGSLEISRGQLRLIFEYTRSHLTYTFRWENSALRLIGFDMGGVSGGCANVLSINFLTARAKLEAGWIDREETEILWRRLPRQPLLAIDQIGDGETFDPFELVTGFPLRCPPPR